jgi:hypothetical protein
MMGWSCGLSVTGLDDAEVASSSSIVSIGTAGGQGQFPHSYSAQEEQHEHRATQGWQCYSSSSRPMG